MKIIPPYRIIAILIGVFALFSCTQETVEEDPAIETTAVNLDFKLLDPPEIIFVEEDLKNENIAIEKGKLDRGRFEITLKYQVPVPPEDQVVFQAAADRWERIIIKDLPSISSDIPSSIIGFPDLEGPIDDIIIEIVVFPIDGQFGTLAFAGPRFVRLSNDLPVSGIIVIDGADIGLMKLFDVFDDVILHEMGHVLGIGTLWNYNRSLLAGIDSDPYFTGRKANVFWNAEGGEDELPVENFGGPGTILSHWREAALSNELMTGFINLGENPLSRITAGSMRDLGYGSSSVGESFDLPKGTPGVDPDELVPSAEGLNIGEMEELLTPIGVVIDN